MSLNIKSVITGLAIGVGVAITIPTTIQTTMLLKDTIEGVKLMRRNEFNCMVDDWKWQNAKVCEHSPDNIAEYGYVKAVHFRDGIMPPHCNEETHYELLDIHERQSLLGQMLWIDYSGRSALRKKLVE